MRIVINQLWVVKIFMKKNMIKHEAKSQVILTRIIRECGLRGAFELKQTTGDSLLFNSIPQHQIDGLTAIQTNGFVWKLSDLDIRTKPFDMISTPPMFGYVVIHYKKHNIFTIILIYDFVNEKENSHKKSLHFDRAYELAEYAIRLRHT